MYRDDLRECLFGEVAGREDTKELIEGLLGPGDLPIYDLPEEESGVFDVEELTGVKTGKHTHKQVPTKETLQRVKGALKQAVDALSNPKVSDDYRAYCVRSARSAMLTVNKVLKSMEAPVALPQMKVD